MASQPKMGEKSIVRFDRTADGLQAASQWLKPRVDLSGAVIVGATRAAADEFAREVPIKGTLGLHRVTLIQAAEELARFTVFKRGLSPLSRLGAEAVAARIIHRLYDSGNLRYFAPVAKLPGFAAAFVSTLSDLRLARIHPENLASDSRGPTELGRLLAEYERELEERELVDVPLLLSLATEFANSGDHFLLGLPLVLLDIPLGSPAHEAFLKTFAKRTPEVFAIVQRNDDKRVSAFEAFLSHADGHTLTQSTTNGLARVITHLFSATRPPETAYDDSIDLFSAPGEGLECVEIARRIRGAAQYGIPFDKIVVLLRNIERYQPMLEEAMSRAGIPTYFSIGSSRPDPAGRAFLALLACASERCSASRFAEYLSIGEAPYLNASGELSQNGSKFVLPEDEMLGSIASDESQNEHIQKEMTSVATPIAWERLLIDASVIGGPERRRRRLHGLQQEYKLQVAELRRVGATEEASQIERQLERLQNLERFALPLIDILAAFPNSARWADWLLHLRQLAAASLRHPDSILSTLSELEPMAEVGPANIDEIRMVLANRLRFLRREPPQRRYGHVLVASIEDVRGRSFDLVFLPGLAEGLFPRRPLEDPLLLDSARRKLSSGLQLREDRLNTERQLLHLAAGAATRQLVASFPSMGLAIEID